MEKKKSKAPIIVIIIMLLAAAGFGYWKFVYQPNQLAQYELPDTVVETELVAGTNWHDDEIENYKEVFATMAENDASYYIIESMSIRYDDYWSPRFKVYQTNKAEFDEKSVMNAEKAVKDVDDVITDFFNLAHNTLPASMYEGVNNDGLFGKMTGNSWAQEVVDPQFGGSVSEYFRSHELVLKCDDCRVEQIGFSDEGYTDDGLPILFYYFNITASVLTEDCIGDMNDLGIFADKGETKEISVKVLCGYGDNSKALSLCFMLVD